MLTLEARQEYPVRRLAPGEEWRQPPLSFAFSADASGFPPPSNIHPVSDGPSFGGGAAHLSRTFP